MIYTTARAAIAEITVSLMDSSNISVTGILFSAVTAQTRKQGGGFITKTLVTGDWDEFGDGIYKLTLTANELDTAGFVRLVVSGSSFETYRVDIAIVDDYLTNSQHLIDIKEVLTLKTNINDVDTLFSQQENRVRVAEDTLTDLESRINHATAALNASRN